MLLKTLIALSLIALAASDSDSRHRGGIRPHYSHRRPEYKHDRHHKLDDYQLRRIQEMLQPRDDKLAEEEAKEEDQCKEWWCYSKSECSPGQWQKLCKKCSGKQQSPIDIDTKHVKHDHSLSSLKFDNFDLSGETDQFEVVNNGHTVEAVIAETVDVFISGSILPNPYRLLQFHFHWGKSDSQGSENGVDGKSFSAEMHMVFLSSRFDSVAEALKTPSKIGNVAVLSTFIEEGDEMNAAYEPFLDAVWQIKESKGDAIMVDPFPLGAMLPDNTRDIYHYKGSFTTPPCNENIEWFLFREHASLSEDQLEVFRSVKDGDGNELADNFRNQQSMNDREVHCNF